MSGRALGWLLLFWAVSTGIGCRIVVNVFRLRAPAPQSPVVASVWERGRLVARAFLAHVGDAHQRFDADRSSHPYGTLVYETIVGEGPVLRWPEAALALSFVPGHDGVAATLGNRTEILTPDDLLSAQAYDKGIEIPGLGVRAGIDVPIVFALLSERFGTAVDDVSEHAHLSRVRVVRSLPHPPESREITPVTMTTDDVREGALAAAHYLSRGVDEDGRFRYLVDAPTNRLLAGYDWPRHAGATLFLAQMAGLTHDAELAWAALRAAGLLRDHAMVQCGNGACIGTDSVVDIGSTALSVLAFVEIANAKLDAGYRLLVPALTAFMRAQQRPDGEFMHLYDRAAGRAIDTQLLYYTGEAALALSRAHSLLGDERDLQAANRALAHLVSVGWTFFGSRYYFGEEHWTCLAMDDLWDRAPNGQALDFCLRWHAYGRHLQYRAGDSPFDADGAYGFGPVLTPRLTPVASRSEAVIATLDAARRAGVARDQLNELEDQARKSLANLLRHQFRPGPEHLFADPAAVAGAMPASEVDWGLRVDFTQHTGSALLRWMRDVTPR